MSTVFLSHSHADKAFVRKLAADLRLAGHPVWIDEAEINIGDSLIEKIRNGLDQVDFVAAVLSRTSIDSPWVTRELDIASNRELAEGRVVVLPIVIEPVQLPGFLKGKFYGDFTDPDAYEEKLALLLRALGPAEATPTPPPEEVAQLREQLAQAITHAKEQQAALQAHEQIALRGKSEGLRAAIREANEKFPSHAPINSTYAFEVMNRPVTLDYLIWAIAKSARKGAHPLEMMLSMEAKWDAVEAMLSAYSELLEAADG